MNATEQVEPKKGEKKRVRLTIGVRPEDDLMVRKVERGVWWRNYGTKEKCDSECPIYSRKS